MCKEGVWGTVCNNLWNTESTSVVCRQLGIGTPNLIALLEWELYTFYVGERGYYLNTFPQGAGPILLANVECTGSEQEFAQCPSVGRFEHSCTHRDDVRIVCIPAETPPGILL